MMMTTTTERANVVPSLLTPPSQHKDNVTDLLSLLSDCTLPAAAPFPQLPSLSE